MATTEHSEAVLAASGVNLPWYRRPAYVFMAVLLAYVLVRGVVAAAGKLFWFDELLTLTVAGQPTLHDMWKVMWRGFDVQPPLFYLIERAMLSLPVKKEVALRLPSIVAFPCMLVCVFAYVKKRSGEAAACVSALLFLSTILFTTYQTEARPYGLLMACIAFALVCYQRLDEEEGWQWTALFAGSLVLAEALHHYAVFAMIPFWLAEGMVVVTKRRVRWRVWLALVCAFLPLTYSYRLLLHSKEFYGTHYWALPDYSVLRGYYAQLLLLKEGVLGMAVAIVALAGVGWGLWSGREKRERDGREAMDWPEAALVAGYVVLPFMVYVIERIVHGTQANRYFLAVLLGVALGIGAGLKMAGPRAAALLAVFLLAVVALRESTFWRHPEVERFDLPYSAVTTEQQLEHLQEFVESGGHADLPIVTDDPLLYTQIVCYGQPSWTKRLVLMVDEEKEFRGINTDTGGRIARALQGVLPLRLVEYAPFEQQHREFLLFTGEMGWLYRSYMEEGAFLEMLRVEDHRWLVLVRPKVDSARQQ